MRKVVDPHTNLLAKRFRNNDLAYPRLVKLPKSKRYRKEMECLLGAVVDIRCDNWNIYPITVSRKPCDKILLLDAKVVGVPEDRNVALPIVVNHLWIIVDSEWRLRNDIQKPCPLLCRGYVRLYQTEKGQKNIGFGALSVKPIREEGEQ